MNMLFSQKSHVVKTTIIAGFAAVMSTQAFAAGGSEAGGLPQLDFTTWPPQLFWLAVTFLIGYILMRLFVVPSIGTVLEDRRTRISSDLEAAKSADAEAQAMRAEYEAELEAARSHAADAARAAMDDAKAEAEKTEAALAAKLSKKVKTAETKLSKMRDEALSGLNDAAQDVVIDIVGQVAGLKSTAAEAKKAVTAAAKAQES